MVWIKCEKGQAIIAAKASKREVGARAIPPDMRPSTENIDCEAKDCVHNRGCKSCADSCGIGGGADACQCQDTECW